MHNDLFESISQGKHREDDEEDGRLEEIANILFRSCCKNEGQSHSGQTYRASIYDEQDVIQQYIKDKNCWISLDDMFKLGIPGPSGSENDTYVDLNGSIVYKMNNLIHTGSFYRLFHRLILHNQLFPQTAYKLYGFTGYEGRTIYPVLTQRYVEEANPAEPSEIRDYMLRLGFSETDEWTFQNELYLISDLKPKNVLRDFDGDLFVVDAEIQLR